MPRLTAHSIFNDVLGPIMAGPSSSHSAGCARIGLTVCHLFDREIRRADDCGRCDGNRSTYVGSDETCGNESTGSGYDEEIRVLASAMAAAAVVEMLGGTVEQGFRAASLALQNMLGLICDPVGGLTEIPCISRNVAAVSNAITSANMVLLGFDPMIPLDETIQSMYEVGQMLPEELRCTCNGGLCTTPTGMCLGQK